MKKHLLILIVTLSTISLTNAQESKKPTFNFNNGIGVVAPDSLFSINFRFRTQLRAAYTTVSPDDFSASEIEARVRRMRLRFEGFLVDPRLNYSVQLSFSRGDMDWVDNDNSVYNSSPNVVRDAFLSYKLNHNLTLIFGQTKLPGNRQRVVSSGDQQFADRSIVNATFNIDRDFGFQFAYLNNISFLHYALKGAISSGEGRNSVSSDGGLAYTGRVELLPFGKFTNKGDYFEGDLEREKSPKLSIAGGYHYNDMAVRSAGTLGKDLYGHRNISSLITDMLFKYQGFAVSGEFIKRMANDPITVSPTDPTKTSIIYVGDGKLAQVSYLFRNNLEIAGRYALITPTNAIESKVTQKEEIGLGVTKYLRKHRVKLQGNIYYNTDTKLDLNSSTSKWTAMFQVELGI